MDSSSTIYALASGYGKAGVAVVRISGPLALGAVAHLSNHKQLTPRTATLLTLSHHGAVIDRALAVYFPAPHSFTGEDVLELHIHGSPAVLKLLLAALSRIPGFRAAAPGEFSRRAFLNQKLDLLEAEGLADLINAETAAQHRQALRQLSGEASSTIHALREKILEPLALLEAYIDFPDEEIPPQILVETSGKVAALRALISQLLADGGIGEAIREGVEVVIFGPPNAGKSSLINLLSKRDVAIVSPLPGTTRDTIEVHLELGGYAVTLVDTAGLREVAESIEAEGVRRARAKIAASSLKIMMLESYSAAEDYKNLAAEIDNNTLIIINKIDIAAPPALPFPFIPISAQRGDGIEKLIGSLVEKLQKKMESHTAPLITRTRHRDALSHALRHLGAYSPARPLELACEELRRAAYEIGKITGKIEVDELLDLVFSRFCIGK